MTVLLWLALFIAGPAWASHAAAQPLPVVVDDREIVHLQGDLYRVRNGQRHSVFLVTAEGILLADPLGRANAEWLLEQFAARFPGRPVRFLVLGHHHYTRSEGAGLFKDAEIIGHDRFNDELQRARSDERYARITSVVRRFKERETITLGGETIEAIHVGYAGAPEMTLLYFPKGRVAFTADVPFTNLSSGFGAFRPRDVMRWADIVASLELDQLVIGDGRTMSRAETTGLAQYLKALTEAVAIGYEAGSSAGIEASALLDSYRTTPFYQGRTAQIPAVYRDIQLLRSEVYGVAMVTFLTGNEDYCQNYDMCGRKGRVTAGSVGLSVSLRRVGLAFEFSLGTQAAASRASRFYDDDLVYRDSRGSVLARLATDPGRVSFAALGGVSMGVTDVRGETIVRGAVPPVGGRQPLADRRWKFGLTFGADMVSRIGSTASLIAPVRVTRAFASEGVRPSGPLDIQAGIGLSVRVLRRVRR